MDNDSQHKPHTKKKIDRFLKSLAAGGNVSESAKVSDMDRSHLYHLRRVNAEFAEKWDAALDLGISALEDEALARAFDRQDRNSYLLLMFLLKAHRPAKYRDTHSQASDIGGNVDLNVAVAEMEALKAPKESNGGE